jgi:hypothetical protein
MSCNKLKKSVTHWFYWIISILASADRRRCYNFEQLVTRDLPATTPRCRSEPARERRKATAGNQTARVIVDDHREQARSYRESAVCIEAGDATKHCGSGLARDDGITFNISVD